MRGILLEERGEKQLNANKQFQSVAVQGHNEENRIKNFSLKLETRKTKGIERQKADGANGNLYVRRDALNGFNVSSNQEGCVSSLKSD